MRYKKRNYNISNTLVTFCVRMTWGNNRSLEAYSLKKNKTKTEIIEIALTEFFEKHADNSISLEEQIEHNEIIKSVKQDFDNNDQIKKPITIKETKDKNSKFILNRLKQAYRENDPIISLLKSAIEEYDKRQQFVQQIKQEESNNISGW